MQMRRKAVAQLARVGGEVEHGLAQLAEDHLAGILVAADMGRGGEVVALADGAEDGPQDEVGHVGRDRRRERGKLRRKVADLRRVAVRVGGDDVERADALGPLVSHESVHTCKD